MSLLRKHVISATRTFARNINVDRGKKTKSGVNEVMHNLGIGLGIPFFGLGTAGLGCWLVRNCDGLRHDKPPLVP
jgi:hypothetical protein